MEVISLTDNFPEYCIGDTPDYERCRLTLPGDTKIKFTYKVIVNRSSRDKIYFGRCALCLNMRGKIMRLVTGRYHTEDKVIICKFEELDHKVYLY